MEKTSSDLNCDNKDPEPENTAAIRLSDADETTCREAAEKLAAGFLAHYEPKLRETKQKLAELTTKQQGMIEEMQEENRKLSEAQCAEAVQEMFSKVKLYQAKLAAIKKEMTFISEKSGKLKKRALKLQQSKQKEVQQRRSQRERQLQREQELIAKPSTSGGRNS